MIHVTCRLTAKNRDQLRNPALGNRVWATFTFFVYICTLCTPRRRSVVKVPWNARNGVPALCDYWPIAFLHFQFRKKRIGRRNATKRVVKTTLSYQWCCCVKWPKWTACVIFVRICLCDTFVIIIIIIIITLIQATWPIKEEHKIHETYRKRHTETCM